MYLIFIRVIGHKTSLSTSQVTATNLSRVRGGSTNHISLCNPESESEPRGVTKERVFFKGEEILRKCVGSRSVFSSSRGIIYKVFSLCEVSLWQIGHHPIQTRLWQPTSKGGIRGNDRR